jgi:hypothetical protein
MLNAIEYSIPLASDNIAELTRTHRKLTMMKSSRLLSEIAWLDVPARVYNKARAPSGRN